MSDDAAGVRAMIERLKRVDGTGRYVGFGERSAYGAVARSQALEAGYEKWTDVTQWPLPPDDTEHDEAIKNSESFGEAIWEIGEKYDVPLTNNLPRWQDGEYVRECAEFYGDILDAVGAHWEELNRRYGRDQ